MLEHMFSKVFEHSFHSSVWTLMILPQSSCNLNECGLYEIKIFIWKIFLGSFILSSICFMVSSGHLG